jgi:segregation and condensation protein B
MEISQIIPHVEALIFAADRPLPLLEIVDLLNNALAFLEDRTNLDQVEAAMEAIREKYSSEFYAFEIRNSGGGYQFLTKKDYYQTVAQLNGDKFLKRLSTAALETLAIIAYRQPISKGEIEYIRGVSTDYSIQKLLEKELIVITGRSEDLPGKPLLYGISRSFMDYFGIASVADLPKLKEIFDEESVQPTLINDETATLGRGEHGGHTETAHSLMVSEDGELLDPDHQLDLITSSPDEAEETPASEDEEVEPDDEIVRLENYADKENVDDIIEDVLEGKDTDTSDAEADEDEGTEEEEGGEEDGEDEDGDEIMEDAIDGEEQEEEEEDDDDNDGEEDGDNETDDADHKK